MEWLHAHGRFGERCDCNGEGCEGWAMGHQWEDAMVEDEQHPTSCPPPAEFKRYNLNQWVLGK